MIRLRPAALVLVLILTAVSCRIEDRTPRGSRRDEDAIQHLLAGYARRLDARVLRIDLRQEHDLAAAWMTTRRRVPAGSGTAERDCIEHIVLRRTGGEWRILSVAATQGPRRR